MYSVFCEKCLKLFYLQLVFLHDHPNSVSILIHYAKVNYDYDVKM